MLNMDFGRKVVVRTNEQEWAPSPAGGVVRKPLAREEAERGHATSVVRYKPRASFKRHEHPLGEEILHTFLIDTFITALSIQPIDFKS